MLGKNVCFAISCCGHSRPDAPRASPWPRERPPALQAPCRGMAFPFLLTLSLLHFLKASGEFSPYGELQTWPRYSLFTAEKESSPLLT